MNEWFWTKLDRLVGLSFPPASRRFLTIRNIILAVLCLFAFNAAFETYLYRERQLPKALLVSTKFLQNPGFLIPYGIFLVLGFLFIARANVKSEHAYLKACIFGMLFAGLLGTLWILLFPVI